MTTIFPAFSKIVPTSFMYVKTTGNDANNGSTLALAKQTIQAAIDAAPNGCAVLVKAGTYNERPTFNVEDSGTELGPKWCISTDGYYGLGDPSYATITGDGVNSNVAFRSAKNWSFVGFLVTESHQCCIQGTDLGHYDTNPNGYLFNLLIAHCGAIGAGQLGETGQADGIKMSSGGGFHLLGNLVEDSADEGIDIVEGSPDNAAGGTPTAVINSTNTIGFNTVRNTLGTAAGIFWKFGSTNFHVFNNDVDGSAADGIAIGGQGFSSGFWGPPSSDTVYQAANSLVEFNVVRNCDENTMICKGAQGDTLIQNNYLNSTGAAGGSGQIFVGAGENNVNVDLPSLGVDIINNIFIGRQTIPKEAGSTTGTVSNNNSTVNGGVPFKSVGSLVCERFTLSTAPATARQSFQVVMS